MLSGFSWPWGSTTDKGGKKDKRGGKKEGVGEGNWLVNYNVRKHMPLKLTLLSFQLLGCISTPPHKKKQTYIQTHKKRKMMD